MKALCLATDDVRCREAHVGKFHVCWSDSVQEAFTWFKESGEEWPTEEECRDAWESTP